MADLRQAGQVWLTTMRSSYASVAITYVRGVGSAATEITTTASIGKTVFNVENGYGVLSVLESRDYMVEAANIAALGEPQRGDRIKQTLDDGKVHLFEVVAPNNEDVFKWHDRYRLVYRVHTKHVGTE